MTTIKAFITKYSVTTYFTLTFVISWGGALLALGGSGMSATTPTDDPRFPLAVLAMIAGPSVSSIVLTCLIHGRAGLRRLLSRLLQWRVGARWYAVAILTAPLVMTVTLFALSLISPAFLPGLIASHEKASLLAVGLAVGLAAGIFEEIGWTGFAMPELRRSHGAISTGLIVGILWGAWHLLTNVLWPSSATAGDVPRSIFLSAGILGVLVGYLPAFRVLMMWVYDRTGSLLVAVLMHVSLTASLLILNPVAISGMALLTYSYALAAAVWVLVAAVAVAQRGQLSRQSPRARVA